VNKVHLPGKSWKKSLVFIVVLWLILLIASLTILSSVVTPFLRTLQTQNLVSLDWAGYSVSSDTLFPQPIVNGVNGSWIIPEVTTTKSNTYSAAWIGIGGIGEETLIQLGSEQDSISGKAVYSLWYELLPDNSIRIPDIAVSPGDKITASITLINSDTNTWQIEIKDKTTGQSFSQSFDYNSSKRTAEWIIERPTVNNQMTTLSNFGKLTFTEITATVGGTTGTISAFPNSVIVMQDRQNKQLTKISDLGKDGSSFSISYTG
jgi:Peptidase A4 family